MPKKHNELQEICSGADAFIIPFKLNELIKGVDPVKLYEYLSFNANVISIYYRELEYFRPHIDFYNSTEEALNLIERLLKSTPINHKEKRKRIIPKGKFLGKRYKNFGCNFS